VRNVSTHQGITKVMFALPHKSMIQLIGEEGIIRATQTKTWTK